MRVANQFVPVDGCGGCVERRNYEELLVTARTTMMIVISRLESKKTWKRMSSRIFGRNREGVGRSKSTSKVAGNPYTKYSALTSKANEIGPDAVSCLFSPLVTGGFAL